MKKKNKLAVFDIDGTIFRKNLHFELLNELVYMKIFKKNIRDELVELYGLWLNNEGTYDAYRDRLVKLYEENISGCRKEDIVLASKKVAHFNAKRIYMFAQRLIEQLREDHTMLIISGSPSETVKEYAQLFHFDAYFGSTYELDEKDIYTGKMLFEPTRDKGAVVRQFAVENNLSLLDSIGIGDTESDAKFLELMARPIAFNPNSNLKKIAEEKGWRIVVEKKDVIYEIANKTSK